MNVSNMSQLTRDLESLYSLADDVDDDEEEDTYDYYKGMEAEDEGVGMVRRNRLKTQRRMREDLLLSTLERLQDDPALVLEVMEAKNIRFVVVLDEAGKVAGLTGQKGLMEFIAEHFPGEVMVQRIGTKHYPEEREGA